MKKVAVSTLEAGLIFTEPVYIDGNNLLVPAGVPIRERDIERLTAWGVESVETEGEPAAPQEREIRADAFNPAEDLESSIAEDLAESIPDSPSDNIKSPIPHVFSLTGTQKHKGGYQDYLDLIEQVEEVFVRINADTAGEIRAIDAIMGKLLQAVGEWRNKLISYILEGKVNGHILAKNSVNTALLSAFIAGELKLSECQVTQTVVGALLHDVGMLRLPPHILDKRGGLTETELQRMQGHSLISYKIIVKELHYPEVVGLIGLQHHERWDGEGYPRRISGAEIVLGARIVSVADAFEAMVSEKPYRNSMMGYQAMKNLLADNSRRFDPAILKAFIQTMGIYPIGSIILLNNGAVARVMEVQSNAPLRPIIRLLIDELGKAYKPNEGSLIDLVQEKGFFIARALDPKEIQKNG